MSSQRGEATVPGEKRKRRLDKTHWLYIAVIAAVVLGVVVGLLAQATAAPGQETKNFAT